MILLPLFLAFFVLVLAIGTAWLVMERGRKTTRRGPEVFQEVFESRMKRQALLSGRPTVFQKTWTKGTGVSYEIEASMSHGEIKAALLTGQYSKAAPGLMIFVGLLGTIIFAGLTLLSMTSLKIFGAVVLVLGVIGTIQCANWFRQAAPAFPTPPGDTTEQRSE